MIIHKSAHWTAITKTRGNLLVMDDSGTSISYARHENISVSAAREIVRREGAAAFDHILCRRAD